MSKQQEYHIQSIAINKKAMSKSKAIKWVSDHFGTPKKLDITETEYRFRQKSPLILKKNGYINYYTKQLPNGVNLIITHK